MVSEMDASWLAAEQAREAARVRSHSQEAARYRGVAWSGFAPEPYALKSPAALKAAADTAAARHETWRASRKGRLFGAVAAAQRAAEAAHGAGEAVRAALNRSGEGDEERCKAAAAEVERHALTLLAAAREVRAVASS